MSAGYAERLSEYPNKGECGLPENYDSQRAFGNKLDKLAQLIKQSRYTVVLTGAGISTSAGIPDFRGPSGIWTKEQQERKRKRKKQKQKGNDKQSPEGVNNAAKNGPGDTLQSSHEQQNTNASPTNGRKRKQSEMEESDGGQTPKFISFENALPTYTHRALTHLILHPPPVAAQSNDENDGNDDDAPRTYLHHIVTQNVDGLHRKTNLPRNKMSVLHGCIFTEICDTCRTEHVSKHEIQSIGLKHTGRECTLGGSPAGSCPGKLKDTLLDWEDDLPETDWAKAQEECSKADLVMCLGTSLRIEPAGGLCEYPTAAEFSDHEENEDSKDTKKRKRKKARKKEGKLGYAIVNLQQTPYDDGAKLVVRGKVDDVMNSLMLKLGYGNNWEVPGAEQN